MSVSANEDRTVDIKGVHQIHELCSFEWEVGPFLKSVLVREDLYARSDDMIICLGRGEDPRKPCPLRLSEYGAIHIWLISTLFLNHVISEVSSI